jgi:hypothetical protein
MGGGMKLNYTALLSWLVGSLCLALFITGMITGALAPF